MGAAGSIQTIEVSFINDKTGKLLLDKDIKKVIEKVTFDFNNGFYNKYKEKGAYAVYSKFLRQNK